MKQFELTLLWPLRFFLPLGVEEGRDKTQDVFDELVRIATQNGNGPWRQVTDTLARERHLDAEGDAEAERRRNSISPYAEGVYFHPYIQKLLYGRGVETKDGKRFKIPPPFRLLTRTDINRVKVVMKKGDAGTVYNVRTVDLYLFSSEVAVLAMSIEGGECALDEYLTLAAWFRRSFPPFWRKSEGDGKTPEEEAPGHCPYQVAWGVRAKGVGKTEDEWPEAATSDVEQPQPFADHFAHFRSPMPSRHWRFLLEPLTLFGGERDERLRYQLLGDDRIPLQSFIAFHEIRALTRGEWIRLATCEPPGSWPLPYAEPFLSSFEDDHCYDRYWSEDGGPVDAPPGSYPKALTTRFLLTGHSFCLATQAQDSDEWALNQYDGLLAHSRHHYFQLCLLAHVHKASLLVFSDRLAEAVDEEDQRDYHRRIAAIAREFARFIDRLWVGEVTNQIQGLELFTMLGQQMRSEQLFEQVKGEIDFVHQCLTNERNERTADGQMLLAMVAFWGLALGAFLSALGMNVFVADLTQWFKGKGVPAPVGDWLVFVIYLAVFGGGAMWVWGWIKPRIPSMNRGG